MPYTYTLAQQANATGVPIVRPLYLNYRPTQPRTRPDEYLYGDNLLVAPITTPNDANGNGSASVWVPPGAWTDWFTGTTYTGPDHGTITAPLSRMPVLVRGGGIVPTRTDYVDNGSQRPLTQVTVNVAAGGDGDFALYQDAGEGAGYRSGQSTSTPLSWRDGARTLTIGATTGTYPGAPTGRSYTLRLENSVAPTAVFLDGVQLPETAWAYNATAASSRSRPGRSAPASAHTISLSGSARPPTRRPARSSGPANLCLDVRGGTAAEGQPVQLYTCNHTRRPAGRPTRAIGTVRVLGRCLDRRRAPRNNAHSCRPSPAPAAPAQTWTRQTDGTLINLASGGAWTCRTATPRRARCSSSCTTATPPRRSAGSCRRGRSPGPGGLCGDVADADPSSATPLQLYTCNAATLSASRRPVTGRVRVFGKCLDARDGGTGNGTPVQLWDCNGTAVAGLGDAAPTARSSTRSPAAAWTTPAASSTPATGCSSTTATTRRPSSSGWDRNLTRGGVRRRAPVCLAANRVHFNRPIARRSVLLALGGAAVLSACVSARETRGDVGLARSRPGGVRAAPAPGADPGRLPTRHGVAQHAGGPQFYLPCQARRSR